MASWRALGDIGPGNHVAGTKDLDARLYVLNAAILSTHEVDSGYWREWELFGVPGGLQLFLLLNLLAFLLLLVGLLRLARGARSGHWFALGVASAGLFAFAAHGYFLLGGEPRFRTTVSLALLAATAAVSLLQARAAVRGIRSA
jgi:Family of unknown function (DUF6713)